ncbi:MAG TPA: signal peptidase I [Rubrobacter sp.]|nr:signal peptidase I [Rubrobacter sp.]
MNQAPTMKADTDRGQDPRRPDTAPPESRGSVSGRRGLLVLALSLIVVFGFVRPFVVEPFYVPSDSMNPTLRSGDSVLVAKFAYRLADPQRNSLVVFESPTDTNKILMKRVVGVAGDRVAVRDGVLFVNGERKSEPYVNYRLTDSTFFGPARVPEDHVFVMGDNRSNSVDSRSFGAVPEEDLLGEAFVRFWPLGRAGTP